MKQASLFDRIGGLSGARLLAERFYAVMERDPATQGILRMHPRNLSKSRAKLYRFIAEWLGGPPIFGTPHVNLPWLRLRHRHLAISESERDQWISCMRQAMQELNYDSELYRECLNRFAGAAEYVRNQ